MKKISLNGIWKLSGKPQEMDVPRIELKAKVPGCVQLDLSEQGFLPEDLFMGENIRKAEEYEAWEWWYETEFSAPEERKNVYLCFGGVDCIAEYYLNGEFLGKTDNMLIPHEFRIDEFLKDGANRLVVHILSPAVWLNGQDYSMNEVRCSWMGYKSDIMIRKPPHSFGWDIMPRAVTSGIWREVNIEVRDEIRFSQIHCCWPTSWSKEQMTISYQLECPHCCIKDLSIRFYGSCGDSSFDVTRRDLVDKVSTIGFFVPNIKLWWPYGYGEPNVYDAVAEIYMGDKLVHSQNFSFGLRTVELQRSDVTDGKNGYFRFLINGTEIMCKGTNWVPLDAFHSRDKERYAPALALVRDIGCNIMRCWGGNVYEEDEFFDFCDRNGIMVWQDFAMGCRWYPQTEEFARRITAEAKSVIRRLRSHPSLILWAGDNEVDIMAAGNRNPEENTLTRKVLPAVVAAEDGTRPYLPSSPYMSPAAYEGRNSVALPEDHLWGPRDYFKSDYYKYNKAHFVSETGYHGCPSPESVRKFIEPEHVWPYKSNPQWILHSSDQEGNEARVLLMANQIKVLFGSIPDNLEDFSFASQISQAEAKKFFIERIRTGRPNKTGVIWWNLLDGWPQMSDAIVDYYFDRKLAYSYVKRAQAPFAVLASDTENGIDVFACNDTLKEASGRLCIYDAETDELLADLQFTAGENASTKLTHIDSRAGESRMFIFKWEANGEAGVGHHLLLTPPISYEWYKNLMNKFEL